MKQIPIFQTKDLYLKENGIMGTNTLDFKEHSMIIDGSMSDG
jgi:hypothetical protein